MLMSQNQSSCQRAIFCCPDNVFGETNCGTPKPSFRVHGGIQSCVAAVKYCHQYTACRTKQEFGESCSLAIRSKFALVRDSHEKGSMSIGNVGGAVLTTIITIANPRIVGARFLTQIYTDVNVAAMAAAAQFMHDGIIAPDNSREKRAFGLGRAFLSAGFDGRIGWTRRVTL